MALMHPELEAIDKIYIQIKDQLFPPVTKRHEHADVAYAPLHSQKSEVILAYEEAIKRFGAIFPQLSVAEVITGYLEGSELLQRNIAGRISQNVQEEFKPLMIEAIRSDHAHTAPLFLQALARSLGVGARDILLESLQSSEPGIRETAVYMVGEVHLVEALPILDLLLKDIHPDVILAAQRVLMKLR